MSREKSSSEREERENNRSIPREEVTLTVTWTELDAVAQKIGLDDGKVLYAMLAKPEAQQSVDDYMWCVSQCKDLLGEGSEAALIECIRGCASASGSPTKGAESPGQDPPEIL